MKFGTWRSKWKAVRRNLRRFWPALVVMGLIMALLVMGTDLKGELLKWELHKLASLCGNLMGFYGIICALLMMSDNFKPRYVQMHTSFPETREDRYLGICLSGLVMMFLPMLLGLILVVVQMNSPGLVAQWGLYVLIFWVYGFGVGMLSASLTSTVTAAILIGWMLVYGASSLHNRLEFFVESLIPGIAWDVDFMLLFAPMAFFKASSNFEVDWLHMGCVAVGGLLMVALGLLAYRKRSVESAGKVMAFSRTTPVIKTLCTIMVGLTLAEVLAYFSGQFTPELGKPKEVLARLLVGFLVTRLLTEMIVEKTVRVFKKKQLLHYGLCVVAVTAIVASIHFDVFGLISYVPKIENIVSVQLGRGEYDSDGGFTINLGDTYESTEDITIVTNFHRSLVSNLECCTNNDEAEYSIHLIYTLKSGLQIRRDYTIDLDALPVDEINETGIHPLEELLNEVLDLP